MQKIVVHWKRINYSSIINSGGEFYRSETVEPEPQPQPMPVDDGGLGCLGVIKIIFYIFIFAGLIGEILHLFG